jgi:hypothetical protein
MLRLRAIVLIPQMFAFAAEDQMKKNYDFSGAVRNPYAKRLKKQLTIRFDEETIVYFQGLGRKMSGPPRSERPKAVRKPTSSRR